MRDYMEGHPHDIARQEREADAALSAEPFVPPYGYRVAHYDDELDLAVVCGVGGSTLFIIDRDYRQYGDEASGEARYFGTSLSAAKAALDDHINGLRVMAPVWPPKED